MDARSTLVGAASGLLVGVVATLVSVSLAGTDGGPRDDRDGADTAGAVPIDARGPELGDDANEIGGVRVTVETSGANGAGSTNPIVVWFDNRGSRLADDPLAAFAAGHETTAVLTSKIPRTVGELRSASIVLTMALERGAISASWKCRRARVEVRLVGEERYRPYLDRDDVGWLSLDEPPRRSLAFALQ